MIKRTQHTYADGSVKTQIRVVEGYRPFPGAKTKQRTIRDFGCIEDQPDTEAFIQAVETFNKTFKEENAPLRIETTGTARMYSAENRRLNYGYKFLEAVYDRLGVGEFIQAHEKAAGFRGKYSPAEIFKFLVMLRILSPDSKRASCQARDNFYGLDATFSLEDVYRALGRFAGFETELQRQLNESIKGFVGRDLSYAFYDVTNYFFHIDFNDDENGDGLRFKGVSKEHRTDPIVGMGLFMDANGLPVSMSIFAGNKSEKKTLEPTMVDIKASYGLGRIVVVADKGLNSGSNIDMIVNNGDGFVFSQILKGTHGKRYQGQLFDPQGWVANESGTYAWKMFDDEYIGHDSTGKQVVRKRKVLLYWDKADAQWAARKRDEKLKKAAKSVTNNAYSIKKGQDEFIKEDIVVKETGEYLDAKDVEKKRALDLNKADADAMYDGYFCIITSEMEMSEREIRSAYGGLWRIEQSFRILKSDLYARPVFVSDPCHIRAHFLICFVALLIVRVIQHFMREKPLSAERIATALSAATCRVHKGGVVQLDDVGGQLAFKQAPDKNGNLVDLLEFSGQDQIALDYETIQRLFGSDIYNTFLRQETFNHLLKKIMLA